MTLGLLTGAALAAAPDWAPLLAFEAPGWDAWPEENVHADTAVFHGGGRSLRLEAADPAKSVQVMLTTDVRFAGKELTLSGWLRTEDVQKGALLWLTQLTGPEDGQTVASEPVLGTSEWTLVTVTTPLLGDATAMTFGVALQKEGRVWVDDLDLRVDGVPIAEVPLLSTTALDTDHEFDAGSGLTLPELTPAQVEDLVLLGEVWGFLKVHHPGVAAGRWQWDYELFRILPQVLAAPDARGVLAEWIASFGPLDPCEPCAVEPVDPPLAADLAWIRDTARLGEPLSGALVDVWEHRPADGASVWVSLMPGTDNPDLSAELVYEGIEPSDDGFRLLALYRFWNLIAYWFPYRDLIDSDWEDVLRRAVPEMAVAREPSAYATAILRVAAEVKDTHTNLWSGLEHRPPTGPCTVPVRVRFLGDEIVVWQLWGEGDAPGLAPGDRVVGVDGATPLELVDRWGPLYAASNEPTRRRDLARTFLNGECVPAKLRVVRGGAELEVEAPRVPIDDEQVRGSHERPGPVLQWLTKDVAYLKMSAIERDSGADLVTAVRRSRGLVIDLRSYPGAFAVFDLGNHLVAATTPFMTFTKADLANPGAFVAGVPEVLTPVKPRYKGQVVILVDEGTQSQAEYSTMAFRTAPEALVVGSTTAGADGDVSAMVLPGGHRVMMSGIGIFYPDGTPTQRIGIVPDVEVHPTAEGFRDGRDEVLEEALRQILGPDAPLPAPPTTR